MSTYVNPHPFIFNNQRGINPEGTLYGSMFEEIVFLFGWDIVYLQRSNFNQIYATGEFQTKVIESANYIRGFIKQEEAFIRSDMFQKFGFFPNDYMDLFIPKSFLSDNNITLQAGDIVYVPISKKIFEIEQYSDRDSSDLDFYFGGANPAYHLSCRNYYPDGQENTVPNITTNVLDQTNLLSTPLDSATMELEINQISNILNMNQEVANTNTTNIQTEAVPDIDTSEVDPLNQ